MSWKKGPMPKDTYDWGGVVPLRPEQHGLYGGGFYFADFKGDHVTVVGIPHPIRLNPEEIAFYNNDLKLPPHFVPPGSGGAGEEGRRLG